MQGVWKNHDLRPISGYISELMQDRAIVRRPCSDFMDMLRRLISCRIIIIIIIIIVVNMEGE